MVAVRAAPGKVTRPMWAIYRRFALVGLRILIGALFVYAGLEKARAAAAFADDIAAFQLLPPMLVDLLALGLPPLEILLGAGLVVGWKPRTAAFCAMLLGNIFLLALGSAGIRGIPVECGCFGSGGGALLPKQELWLSISRDLLLIGAAAVVYLDARRADRLPS